MRAVFAGGEMSADEGIPGLSILSWFHYDLFWEGGPWWQSSGVGIPPPDDCSFNPEVIPKLSDGRGTPVALTSKMLAHLLMCLPFRQAQLEELNDHTAQIRIDW